ncbi:MAG: hypothetical protein WA862_03705 [Solirubrobacterales bacterium]
MREESKRRDEESKRRDRERREEFERLMNESERRTEETREFNREILLRNEKVYTAVIAQLEENTEQIRANTKAVLSLLDRFNGSDGLAA